MRSSSHHRSRTTAARAIEEDDDCDGDSLEDTITPPVDLEATIGPAGATMARMPFLQRLRSKFGWWGTREEKRSLWTGSTPRRERAQRRAQRQSTIGVPTDHLLPALRSALAAAGEEASDADFAEFSALLRLQLRHELMESSLWLVDAFDMLSSDGSLDSSCSSPTGKPTAAAGPASGEEDVEALSDRFIDGLCALMQRANFRLFSQREWGFAQAENFMFTLPVDVAWEHLDSSTISRLFVRHPHLGLQAAPLARRVLVFHRGSGMARMTSFFLDEKVDMLIDRLLTHPLRRLVMALQALVCPAAAQRAADAAAQARRDELEFSARGAHDSVAQRVNLARALPSVCSLLRRFASRLTIVEPTLQDVVVVYTQLGATASGNDDSYTVGAVGAVGREGLSGGAAASALNNPSMRLKSFRDIPIADVEVWGPLGHCQPAPSGHCQPAPPRAATWREGASLLCLRARSTAPHHPLLSLTPLIS